MKTYSAIVRTAMVACLAMASTTLVYAGDLSVLDPDKIEGKDVMDETGHQLGDVDEVVKGKTGEHMAVIGLEDSTKEVVIPLDELKMSADGESLYTMLDRADLEALPDYDPMDLESVDE
jgi:hypothetical protein